MATLFIRFSCDFRRFAWSPFLDNHGVLFHKWLPNGDLDGIILLDQESVRLKVWFDRCGFVDKGFIRFDGKRREVEPGIMARQGKLEAGPLRGVLELHRIPEHELKAVRDNLLGSPEYISLAKNIVNLLSPRLTRLVRILRSNYGQYWLRETVDWDSRIQSLGYYCARLSLSWSVDGTTWGKFQPEIPSVKFAHTAVPFQEFLAEPDWNELGKVFVSGYDPPLAAVLLSRTNELLQEGNLRHAFVEGVSALEVALQAFVKTQLGLIKGARKAISAFRNLPLSAQALSVAAVAQIATPEDLEGTMEAIELRHRVVHEGWDPPSEAKTKIFALMRTTAGLVPGPKFKFPVHDQGTNKLDAPGKPA